MRAKGWIRRWELLVLLAAGAALFVALDVRGTIVRWQAQQRRLRELERQNVELVREIERRRERLERLRTDQAEQERHLRQQQKRVRPGEELFILPEQPKR